MRRQKVMRQRLLQEGDRGGWRPACRDGVHDRNHDAAVAVVLFPGGRLRKAHK